MKDFEELFVKKVLAYKDAIYKILDELEGIYIKREDEEGILYRVISFIIVGSASPSKSLDPFKDIYYLGTYKIEKTYEGIRITKREVSLLSE